EDPDLLVQAAAPPGDLVLAQVVQAQLLDQPVDLAGPHPVDVAPPPRPRPGPARPAGVARGTTGSSCQRAAWGWPARSSRPGCPTRAGGSRCGWGAARGSPRPARAPPWRVRRRSPAP